MALSWWQHHKHCLGYYYYIIIYYACCASHYIFSCCFIVQKEQIIFLIVLFVAIVVGNMAILLSIVTSKTGKTSRMKYFIMNLAIAGSYTCTYPCLAVGWELTRVGGSTLTLVLTTLPVPVHLSHCTSLLEGLVWTSRYLSFFVMNY